MVHLGGCDLVLLAGMVLTLLTGSPANLVCFFGLMALFSGYSVSAIIRVIGSISNSSDYKLRYTFWKIFHFGRMWWSRKWIFQFGRVLLIMVLKGNILLVIVRIFHFGRVLWSRKPVFCYFTLGGCWGSARKGMWNYWYIVAPLAWDVTCFSSVMYPRLSGCCSFSQCWWYLLQCQFAIHSSPERK